MIGTLSQLVALCSAANGVVSGRLDADSFYPAHPDFRFCNAVRFVDINADFLGRSREVERHNDPNQWLRSVKASRAGRAWLIFEGCRNADAPDHQLAAFIGRGGDWKLVVATETAVESWMSRWEVTAPNAADNRIWGVTYGCIGRSTGPVTVPEPDLVATGIRLQSALRDAHQFAAGHELTLWAESFQRAIDGFESTQPVTFPEYVQFVCLDSYPEAAQRLLAAAYQGWVFGGMGSWNDQGFDSESENDRYHQISAELYAAITDAIQQSTWSFEI